MRAADHVVDFGPGPGVLGGEVVVEGTVDDVLKNERSVTGAFLSGRQKIEVPKTAAGRKIAAQSLFTMRRTII